MKIAVDGMGGDNAPKEVVKGVVDAVNEFGAQIILTGDEELLRKELSNYDYPKENIEIIHCSEVVSNEDKPATAIRKKKDSSMVVAINEVKEKRADAVVSAGNTGALLAGGIFILKRIAGIDRPALCTCIPTEKGMSVLLDAGANADCKPVNLKDFAVMGSLYSEKVLGVDSPKVAIVNVGIEEGKGNELTKESYKLLKETPLNFIGNVEAREISSGYCDVIVCDGFNGNIILKLMEGVAASVFNMLKEVFFANLMNKLAAAVLKKDLKSMKNRLDYAEYGGAPLIGVNGGLIKAHGSSNAKAFKNAIRQADLFAKGNVVEEIKKAVSENE